MKKTIKKEGEVQAVANQTQNFYTFYMDDGRKIVIQAETQREALKLLKQQENV